MKGQAGGGLWLRAARGRRQHLRPLTPRAQPSAPRADTSPRTHPRKAACEQPRDPPWGPLPHPLTGEALQREKQAQVCPQGGDEGQLVRGLGSHAEGDSGDAAEPGSSCVRAHRRFVRGQTGAQRVRGVAVGLTGGRACVGCTQCAPWPAESTRRHSPRGAGCCTCNFICTFHSLVFKNSHTIRFDVDPAVGYAILYASILKTFSRSHKHERCDALPRV